MTPSALKPCLTLIFGLLLSANAAARAVALPLEADAPLFSPGGSPPSAPVAILSWPAEAGPASDGTNGADATGASQVSPWSATGLPSRPEGRWRVGPLQRPPNDFYQTPELVGPWLREVAAMQPYRSTLVVIGHTTLGRPILGLQVLPPTGDPLKWRRLAVICRQHGNEPEATASGTRFLYQWFASRSPQEKRISETTALLFVPVCNPDGAARYRRHTAANVDMNRDWGKLRSPEVRALTQQISGFKPQMVIDVHQWLPAEHQEPSMAEASGGVLAQRAAWAMAWSNAQRGYYLSARSHYGLATLCHRYFGQRVGTPAILLESRHRPGVPGARDLALAQTVTALWSAAGIVAQ